MPKAVVKKKATLLAKDKKRKADESDEERVKDKRQTRLLSKKIDQKLKAKATAKVVESEKKVKGRAKSADQKNTKDDSKKDTEPEKKMVKGIKKGRAMVDSKVTNVDSYRVYDDDTQTYAATLMWSDLKNNNNKFYLIQLLDSEKNKGQYSLWTRWGRVGYDGQFSMQNYTDLDKAKREYEKKYKEKTTKGYTEIETSYDDEDEKPKQEKKAKLDEDEKQVASKLDPSVKDLVKLIFNTKLMQKQMVEIGYDAKKMPLGKLSKETIKRGYEILKQISDVLDGKSKDNLTDLSSKFFTVIPHDFGFKHMSQFVINTKDKLKEKLDMVQSLGDIEIATRLLEEGSKGLNEIDSNYAKLKCEIVTLDKTSEDYKIIEKYINTTHATTHNNFKLDIQSIFKVNRIEEDKKFKDHIGNDMLLWHGSRLTNFVGILSQGLRIAPPEAPMTGYMFGKGIYFADMVSKSANYCCASSSDNIGLLLLCRVAVGTPRDLYQADYNAGNLPAFAHSTKGVGRTAPGVSTRKRFRGMIVPIGPGVISNSVASSLLYNEFIIYDVTQARLEYLIKLKFNCK
jgi:poly [ADP-ribose] polymerase